jgi:ankyrin repeat protein
MSVLNKPKARTEQDAPFFLQALDLEQTEDRITNFLDHLNKTDVDITKSEPIAVLHLAAAFGTPLLVSELIANGANIHSQDKWHQTPLFVAAIRGRHRIVKLLLQFGADAKAGDNEGYTPLHAAAVSGCVVTTTALLENGYGIEIDAISYKGYTALHMAANHGHLPVVELLLKHGADINARDIRGNNVFKTAVDIGHVDLVCWMMQNIKHIDMKPNAENDTPLNVAVKDENIEIIKCLLENGFPLNEVEYITSPLTEAVEEGNVESVNLLLKFGAEVNHEDENGITPLLRAVKKNHYKIVQLLVQHGADLLAVDEDGRTAEQIAKYGKNRQVEKFLKNARRTDGSKI